jgi:hypothetical protein
MTHTPSLRFRIFLSQLKNYKLQKKKKNSKRERETLILPFSGRVQMQRPVFLRCLGRDFQKFCALTRVLNITHFPNVILHSFSALKGERKREEGGESERREVSREREEGGELREREGKEGR